MQPRSYSEKLRSLADWLDRHPEIADKMVGEYEYPAVNIYCSDTTEFGRLCRAMGEGEKEGYGGTLYFTHKAKIRDEHDVDNQFVVSVNVTGACEKVVTGTRTRKVHIPSDARQDENGNWVVDEPEATWKCPDSFLSL